MENKKLLMVRIHDNIKPIPDFATRSRNRPSVQSFYKLDKLLSEILQILKKNNDAFCIIINQQTRFHKASIGRLFSTSAFFGD